MIRNGRYALRPALLAIVLAVVACRGESPTAPTQTGSGGIPPVTGANIVLSLSNSAPLIGSTTDIDALVTNNGSAVPNGTAVEFQVDTGLFTDTNSTTTIRTTTNGVAVATLTATAIGTSNVTVRVNNISKTISVTFQNQPTITPPADKTVTITSFSPATGAPAGGQVITINGTNFANPVRVLVGTVDARVLSVTPTQITAIIPPVNLGPGAQSLAVSITVISSSGQTGEQRAVAANTFQYLLPVLTPTIFAVSPSAGPDEGGTQIAIAGEGFQAPAKVFFGTAGSGGGDLTNEVELQVIQVTFSQIIAVTPPATGIGLPLKDSQIVVRVLNLGSNKDTVLPSGFRYGPGITITAVSPNVGPPAGGQRVTITGSGFAAPVTVAFAGVVAQNVSVSGTQIVAITGAVTLASCADVTNPTTVTNIDTGDLATGPNYDYQVLKPAIIGFTASPPFTEGTAVSVTVNNPGTGPVRFTVGGIDVLATGATTPGMNPKPIPNTYTFVIPLGLTFKTIPCVNGTQSGTQNVTTAFDLQFTNETTTCTDTLKNGLDVSPDMADSVCTVAATPGAVGFNPPGIVFADQFDCTASGNQTVAVKNTGGSAITIGQPVSSAPTEFVVSALTGSTMLNPGDQSTFTVHFDPAATGLQSGTIAVTPVGGTAVTMDVSGTGLPPTILSVVPATGGASTTITITGTNFQSTPTVTVGGFPATGVVFMNATTITAVTPASGPAAGVNPVVVTNPGTCGTATDTVPGFTY